MRVDSQRENKTILYNYDIRGNIENRKEYAYSPAVSTENLEKGTAVKTVNYGYTDATWKDLMTSWNGQEITYDTIGNPLQYRDGMNPLRCPALSAAASRLANRRPQRQPLLAASATGGARRRCLEQREAAGRLQQGPDIGGL